MGAGSDLLNNIECEYKFGLNGKYAGSFFEDLCAKFNEVIAVRYEELSDDFKKAHALDEFKADVSMVRTEKLSNEYFDTSFDHLFKEFQMGLRMRRSDAVAGVEQTVKFKSKVEMGGASHTHVEYNVRCEQDMQSPDLNLFGPGQLPEGLNDILAENPLTLRYRSNFQRSSMVFTVPYFMSFEVAVDQGEINAGICSSPVSEVEFELKSIDQAWLDASRDKTIVDLDDVRFEFSSFINELLLMISGSPTVYVDKYPVNYRSVVLNQSGKYVAAPDLDNAGFESGAGHAVHEMPVTMQKEQSIASLPLKDGGLIGMEPLSKLRRAVVLSVFDHDNPGRGLDCPADTPAVLSVSRGTRVDFETFRAALNSYKRAANPTIELYNHTSYAITEAFTLAVGLANLMGTRQHFEDVAMIMREAMDFSCNHKKLRISDEIRQSHRDLCQDAELSDLSMLIVSECSNMYLEFNVKMWFEPFYRHFAEALENKDFNVEDFKTLMRTSVKNSQGIKMAEYIERAGYILRRKSMLLNDDNFKGNKGLALATQYHMRRAWETINLGS